MHEAPWPSLKEKYSALETALPQHPYVLGSGKCSDEGHKDMQE